MTDHLWLNVLIVLGTIGAAEETLRRLALRPLIRTYRKFEKFLDAWNGEPERDGLPARPGIVDRVIAIEAQNRSMQHELHPNSGSSLRDAIDRTEKMLTEHVTQSAELLERGRASEQEIRGTIATLADAVKIVAQSTPPEEHS